MENQLKTSITNGNTESTLTVRELSIDDCDMWCEFIMNCSKRTVYQRYNQFIDFTNKTINEYCDIGDDQIAFIAITGDENPQIVGEVRLYIFENNPRIAEFAVLVADDWQSMGIGTILTEHILKVGRQHGIEKIIAYTESDNAKMLKIFKKMGFKNNATHLDQTVDLVKELDL